MDLRTDDAQRPHPDDLHELVERKRLLVGLVDDLLGEVRLRTAPLDLRDVAREALHSADLAIRAQGHSPHLDLPAYPVMISGDKMRLFQAISKLLDNAARYTTAGGHISVRVWTQGDEARVSVADDGKGLAPDQLEKIFVALHGGGEAAEEPPVASLGIGLMLARRFIELHGGVMEVASAGLNKGSRFTVRLPALMQPRAAP